MNCYKDLWFLSIESTLELRATYLYIILTVIPINSTLIIASVIIKPKPKYGLDKIDDSLGSIRELIGRITPADWAYFWIFAGVYKFPVSYPWQYDFWTQEVPVGAI